jgi:ATP-dependent HslUV protease ATP-binding subunit HslU
MAEALLEVRNLSKSFGALLATDGVEITFTDDAIQEMARVAMQVNAATENIGARRLHTVMSALMEEVLFELPDFPRKRIVFDADAVRERLSKIVNDDDLRRYIL